MIVSRFLKSDSFQRFSEFYTDKTALQNLAKFLSLSAISYRNTVDRLYSENCLIFREFRVGDCVVGVIYPIPMVRILIKNSRIQNTDFLLLLS